MDFQAKIELWRAFRVFGYLNTKISEQVNRENVDIKKIKWRFRKVRNRERKHRAEKKATGVDKIGTMGRRTKTSRTSS